MGGEQLEQQIFSRGSTTYYFSSKLFPAVIADDVARLYSFVRVADDYVDAQHPQKKAFDALRAAWNHAIANPHFVTTSLDTDTINERVTKNIVFVSRKYAFDNAWVESFLDAMQSDFAPPQYKTLEDTLGYAYGSAEVIGLMMAKIMQVSPNAHEAARLQGRAMQYINFIRDIAEDNKLGRRYFPSDILKTYGLQDLEESTARKNKEAFESFVRAEISRYREWQKLADEGFSSIPWRLRIPVRTAVDMYDWTADHIAADPLIVFERKVKPTKSRVLLRALMNALQV